MKHCEIIIADSHGTRRNGNHKTKPSLMGKFNAFLVYNWVNAAQLCIKRTGLTARAKMLIFIAKNGEYVCTSKEFPV